MVQKLDYYHVLVTLRNLLFSNALFTGKLMALACSILGIDCIILSQDASLKLLIYFGALGFQAIAFYTVSCYKLVGDSKCIFCIQAALFDDGEQEGNQDDAMGEESYAVSHSGCSAWNQGWWI